MNVTMHRPERVRCETIFVEYAFQSPDYLAYVDFKDSDPDGGTLSLHFRSPEELRETATALNLLAESLEEKQAGLK